ncbi:MAG: glycosyltransferase family 2 protein [Saprospiraceae bacterium]|nr:glycosyltransferase family 2 protein [Saprospiraceae bacterium]
MQISAVVITLNEARNIGRCLDSLAGVADEVVVVDSFSTDETQAICESKGARVVQHAFEGYGQQKNWGNAQASHPYILSLDADEALSEALRTSILRAKEDWRHEGYTMNRLTNYCGQWIHHSGWYPDRKLRLFDKRKARWGDNAVHEKVEMSHGSRVGHLTGDLLHYSYYDKQEHIERVRRYADLAARALHAQGRRASWFQVLLSPLAKFLRNYFLKLGFLDGRAGWTICKIAALETYLKYRTLMRLRS